MRWLASRPWWLLAGAFVLAILCVVLGQALSIGLPGGVALIMVFLLFFATLMALVRRQTPPPPSPH